MPTDQAKLQLLFETNVEKLQKAIEVLSGLRSEASKLGNDKAAAEYAVKIDALTTKVKQLSKSFQETSINKDKLSKLTVNTDKVDAARKAYTALQQEIKAATRELEKLKRAQDDLRRSQETSINAAAIKATSRLSPTNLTGAVDAKAIKIINEAMTQSGISDMRMFANIFAKNMASNASFKKNIESSSEISDALAKMLGSMLANDPRIIRLNKVIAQAAAPRTLSTLAATEQTSRFSKTYEKDSLLVGTAGTIQRLQKANEGLIVSFNNTGRVAASSAEDVFRYGRRAAEVLTTVRTAKEKLDIVLGRPQSSTQKTAGGILLPSGYDEVRKQAYLSTAQERLRAEREIRTGFGLIGRLDLSSQGRLPSEIERQQKRDLSRYTKELENLTNFRTKERLAAASMVFNKFGFSGKDPFSYKGQNLDEYKNRISNFIKQLTGEVAGLPEHIRKSALAELKNISTSPVGLNNLYSMNQMGFKKEALISTPSYNLTGERTSIRFSVVGKDGKSHRFMWQGSEQAYLRYRQSVLNAPKIPPETLAPPKSVVGAWDNLRDSFSQAANAGREVYKQIEQPFTSIAIAVSRVAYGIRTIQFGLMAMGASFTAVFGGATKAAQGLASSILEVTEIQKKAQITLQGVFGDKGLADNIIKFARQYAIETPATFREVTGMIRSFGFIPEIKRQIIDASGSTEKLTKTLKDLSYTTIALGITKPEQGIEGAIFSIREALSGQFRSLKMRFEMPMSAVASTVGLTESQLADDPTKVIEAIKNFMDINVGEDTLKKLHRTVSVQIQNISDVFEKAKVEIGQSGFEKEMERLAYSIANSFEHMLNSDVYKRKIQEISQLMTNFSRTMFGYGKTLLKSLVTPPGAMSADARTVETRARRKAGELVKEGFLDPKEIEDFVDAQLLMLYTTDKLTVAYNALLRVLDPVVSRISSMMTNISSFMSDSSKLDDIVNNINAFTNMLFNTGEVLFRFIMNVVTAINKSKFDNTTKALMMFFAAFPVATVQTGIALMQIFGKTMSMAFDLITSKALPNFVTAMSKLVINVGIFAANLAKYSIGIKSAREGQTLFSMATLGKVGLIATLLIGLGALAEKVQGINGVFTGMLKLIGSGVVWGLEKLVSVLNMIVTAFLKAVATINVAYTSLKETVFGKELGTKEEKLIDLKTQRREAARRYNLPESEARFLGTIFGVDKSAEKQKYDIASLQITQMVNEAMLNLMTGKGTEADIKLIKDSRKTVNELTGKQSAEEKITTLVEQYTNALVNMKNPLESITGATEEYTQKIVDGTQKYIQANGLLTDAEKVISNQRRADIEGITNYYASSNIGDVLATIDKFRLKQEFLELQKIRKQYEQFMRMPEDIVKSQLSSHLRQAGYKNVDLQYKSPSPDVLKKIGFDYTGRMEKEKTDPMFLARKAGFDLYVKDAEKKADVLYQAQQELQKSEIELLNLRGQSLESKLLGLQHSIELKQQELKLEHLIALSTMDAAIAAAKTNAERNKLITNRQKLLDIQKQVTAAVKEQHNIEARQLSEKEVKPVLKKFGIDTESLKSPAAYSKFVDYINRDSNVLKEHLGKIEAQAIKGSQEAKENLKKRLEAEFKEATALLTDAIRAEQDMGATLWEQSKRLYDSVLGSFGDLGSNIQTAVNDFAATISNALNGMQIVVNMNAVINNVVNAANEATGGLASKVGGFLGNLTGAATGTSAFSIIKNTAEQMYQNFRTARAAQEASDRMKPFSPGGYKPGGGGGGGKGKKESLEERNRMLKELADSQYVADELRKTAFHGYNENDYKKKIEEINKMKKDGILKEIEAQQYLAAIRTEYNRKEMEFIRKLESERAKELTQYLSVLKEAESNPLVSGDLDGMKSKLMALDIAEGFKEIDFKAKNAAESIKVMNEEMLKQVGLTRESALNLVQGASAIEKQNLIMKLRRENATGFEKGVLNLPSMKETFDKAKEEFVGTLSSGLSEAMANALDPDANESFRESMSKLGKALRRTVIKAFTDALANELVRGLFGGFLGAGEPSTKDLGKDALLGALSGGTTAKDQLQGTVQALTQGMGGLATSTNQTISSTLSEMAATNSATGATYGFTGSVNNATAAVASFAATLRANAGESAGSGLLGSVLSFGSVGEMNTFSGSLAGSMSGGFAGGAVTNALNTVSGRLGLSPARSFASGGIVSAPTLAVVGDNRVSPEVVAPLHKLKDAMGKDKQETQQPTQLNIVNVVDPQMVNKAIMNDPNTVVNVVASDIQSRGTLYTIMRNKR